MNNLQELSSDKGILYHHVYIKLLQYSKNKKYSHLWFINKMKQFREDILSGDITTENYIQKLNIFDTK
jgi:hypothetical protein